MHLRKPGLKNILFLSRLMGSSTVYLGATIDKSLKLKVIQPHGYLMIPKSYYVFASFWIRVREHVSPNPFYRRTIMVNVRLKGKMLEKEVSGYQLARQVGVSDSQFSRIVRGWINPPKEIKKKLAASLGCKVSEIFPEKG